MIRTNAVLLRQVREFFFAYLVGAYNWDNVQVAPPQENPEKDGRRVLARSMSERRPILADAKFRELVRVIFPPWEIVLLSPEESPPCGLATLRRGDIVQETLIEGPPDSETWRLMAAAILEKQTNRELNYGRR